MLPTRSVLLDDTDGSLEMLPLFVVASGLTGVLAFLAAMAAWREALFC